MHFLEIYEEVLEDIQKWYFNLQPFDYQGTMA